MITSEPIEWTATEYQPKRRWWWYIVVAYVCLFIFFAAGSMQNWPLAVLAIVAGLALFRWNLSKPRTWHYRLEGNVLSVEDGKVTWSLQDYRSLYVADDPASKHPWPCGEIILIPKARFRTDVS